MFRVLQLNLESNALTPIAGTDSFLPAINGVGTLASFNALDGITMHPNGTVALLVSVHTGVLFAHRWIRVSVRHPIVCSPKALPARCDTCLFLQHTPRNQLAPGRLAPSVCW